MRQNQIATAQARQLRQVQNHARKRLWALLRNRQFYLLKFRRQVPIGPYIADFYCAERRLIVFLSPALHPANDDPSYADRLAVEGFRILRLNDADVLHDLAAVLRQFDACLDLTYG